VSTTNSLDLYSLLPAIYRIRDAERGYPLRAFLGLVSGQAQLLKADIDGLWDDLFIETCAGWVIPYIGDLVANNPLPEGVVRRRADVARTIYYRRRKGTLTMLEQMARDVTGWDAHAVAFFEQLGWTQNLNHLRFRMDNSTDAFDPYASDRVGTALLRDMDAMDRLDGAFDTTTHTVDVRPPDQLTGWYNIRNIGFFLWRLQSFFMREVTPRQSSTYADGFYFSAIGNPAPLFTHPAPPPLGSQLVTETEVQSPIRKVAFYFRPENYYLQPDIFYTDHPAASKSIAIYHGTQAIAANLIPATKIVCGDLSNWTPPASGVVAIDVALGRLAFAPGETPADGVVVTFAYGFSGTLGGGPYDRRSVVPTAGDPGPAIPNTVADPISLGALIRVPSVGISTISAAIAAWNPAVTPRAVIQIDDNRTYAENLAIAFPAVPPPPGAPSPELVIQAGNLLRPTLVGNMTVTGGTGAEELVLNGLLMAGQLHVQGNLGLIEIVHSTLVPGLALDEQGQPTQPDAPSVLADPPADALELLIDHSITGALRLPEEMPGLFVRDSIIDSPAGESVADFAPAVISGSLSSFPALSSPTPTVNVTIGDEGPYPAVFTSPTVPTSLTDARDSLQAAIRAAHTTIPFTAARVLSANKRLIVLPGSDEEVVIESADSDPTATELRLDPSSARQTSAVVGGSLPATFTLASGAPAVSVALGTDAPQTASLLGAPGTPAQARDSLQAAIRAAGASPGYTGAVVTNLDNQLVAISGDGAAPLVFGAAPADSTTIVQLQLTSRRLAIAADAAGDTPGPPTTLLRSTIFGEVHVQQLPLASEVIFTAVVRSQRRQNGCVRFSFVPEGSVTPRRYRCQPDFEILQRTQQAEQYAALHGLTLSFTDRDAIRDDVRSWLKPSFTDFHYGLPAYGQLSTSCPQQILTGAANESEMGAFCFLQQPQRAASLRVRLIEYLPFGLQPGLIYVT
jgi:hypothetical protein